MVPYFLLCHAMLCDSLPPRETQRMMSERGEWNRADSEVKSSRVGEWKTNDEREKKNERQFEINPFVVKCLFELKLIFLTLIRSFVWLGTIRRRLAILSIYLMASEFPTRYNYKFPSFFLDLWGQGRRKDNNLTFILNFIFHCGRRLTHFAWRTWQKCISLCGIWKVPLHILNTH